MEPGRDARISCCEGPAAHRESITAGRDLSTVQSSPSSTSDDSKGAVLFLLSPGALLENWLESSVGLCDQTQAEWMRARFL